MTLTLSALTDDDRRLLSTAVHEAGHAVTAVTLGGRIGSAVVYKSPQAGRAYGATTHAEVVPGTWSAITYAGPWAEARWAARRRPTVYEVLDVLETGHGYFDNKVLIASCAHTEVATSRNVNLMERCWPAVRALARKLVIDGECHHEDALAALGLTDGGGPGSMQLAMIRSGMATPRPAASLTSPATR